MHRRGRYFHNMQSDKYRIRIPKGHYRVDIIPNNENYLSANYHLKKALKNYPFMVIVILIGAIIALAGVVAYLYKSKEEVIKAKDEKIMKVIEAHQLDQKENNKDYEKLVDRYHEFTQQIKELITYGKRV